MPIDAVVFDLDNVLSVESFVQLVRERPAVVLEEFFPAPDELCATGPEGRYAHELVVPFIRAGAPDTRDSALGTRSGAAECGVPGPESLTRDSEPWVEA